MTIMAKPKIDSILTFRGDGRMAIGRERIKLLEAVGIHGSITKAAHVMGISYKSAWDAIDAMNNLLPRPAVTAQAGGKRGGGAIITSDGQALIAAFHLLESRFARATALLTDGQEPVDAMALLWSLGMKTSARNAFRCPVDKVVPGSVNSEVILRLSSSVTLSAIITAESVTDLGITEGAMVSALIKAPFIMLATGDTPPQISTRNRIPGIIQRRNDGAVNTEISLDIGDGKSLIAIITKDSAEELDLQPGTKAWALIKASHVILAID